jgi:hypothetical protein
MNVKTRMDNEWTSYGLIRNEFVEIEIVHVNGNKIRLDAWFDETSHESYRKLVGSKN